MEIEKIKLIIKETIIEVISSMIVEKMKKKPKLLVVFSGGIFGLEDAILSIDKLKKNNFEMDIVLTKNAENVISAEFLRKKSRLDNIYIEGEKNLVEMVHESDILILPTLTANSAAKIANCISDTYLTFAASQFILLGKPVIAATNSCCPNDQERLATIGRMNKSYMEKMTNNMEQIEKYGVKFTYSKNIERAVIKVIDGKLENIESIDFRARGVITYENVLAIKEGDKLIAQKNSLFTPLAKEYLKSKGISITLRD